MMEDDVQYQQLNLLNYGKEYFKEEFGVDSKIAWYPDSFGFSASLPQILNKCGMEVMVTSKLSWGDANIMPNDLFMWRGIDGSETLTYFLNTHQLLLHFVFLHPLQE